MLRGSTGPSVFSYFTMCPEMPIPYIFLYPPMVSSHALMLVMFWGQLPPPPPATWVAAPLGRHELFSAGGASPGTVAADLSRGGCLPDPLVTSKEQQETGRKQLEHKMRMSWNRELCGWCFQVLVKKIKNNRSVHTDLSLKVLCHYRIPTRCYKGFPTALWQLQVLPEDSSVSLITCLAVRPLQPNCSQPRKEIRFVSVSQETVFFFFFRDIFDVKCPVGPSMVICLLQHGNVLMYVHIITYNCIKNI